MSEQRVSMVVPVVRAVAGLVALAIIVIGIKLAWDRYDERYVVQKTDDGRAVTVVVSAAFARASALKVGSLSGTVQSSASDTRGWGMLTSDRVVKAPFSVDYFVDVSRLGDGAYRWDAGARTLTIDAPAITVGKVNVDEAAQTLSRTRGVFVTRAAGEELARRVSAGAQRAAQAEAQQPARIAAAREQARRALGDLAAAPLRAAGMNDIRVAVTFPGERGQAGERWDTSRSMGEVLGNGG